MILHTRCSHPQHRSHVARVAQLSPTSPQLWITPVYKHVNNQRGAVLFAGNVRLSPSVDHLWTGTTPGRMQHTSRCGQVRLSCEQPDGVTSSSPAIHHNHGSVPTRSPQTKIQGLRAVQALIHTFHTTYDDDYIDRSMSSHTNNDTTAVDDSRTLSTLGSSTGVDGTTHAKTAKYKGGHE
jgi:hypothetical protein